VTANPGTWSGSAPVSFQYQWRICDARGSACHDISGATDRSYQVKSDDPGNTLRVRVIASNAEGSSSATSGSSARVAAASAAPANGSPAVIAGPAQVGKTLTAENGTWSGAPPITYAYQWRRCDENGAGCADISGATTVSYTLKQVDAGNRLRLVVTATNAGGSASSTSVPTAVVTAAGVATPAPVTTTSGCPKTTQSTSAVTVTDVSAPARLQIAAFRSSPSVISFGTQSFQLRVRVTSTCGQPVAGARVYATAVPFNQVTIPPELATGSDGWVTLPFDRLRGFPVSPKQQLLAMFIRAAKPGDNPLAGISTRRLVSLRVQK